jgi:hypothetical protein
MPLLDNTTIQKIVTMCVLNYFCNCLNSQQFDHASTSIRNVLDNFIVDDIITIDIDLYCDKSRSETITMIHQLRTDVSRILQSPDNDTLMDHPLVNKYNTYIYDYHPFNAVVEQYPTTSIISSAYSWINELLHS